MCDEVVISVIICSIDEAKFNLATQNYTSLLEGIPFEIIGIHDAHSLCEGYNRGVAQSRGSILVFSHDDIEIISQDFKDKLRKYLSYFDIIGVAGTSCLINGNWMVAGQPFVHGLVTYPNADAPGYLVNVYGAETIVVGNICALDGLFFAINRSVIEKIRFDEDNFDGFHMYDMDFTFTAYLSGFKLAVCNDILVIHESNGDFGGRWEHYNALFLEKHIDRLCTNTSGQLRIGLAKAEAKEEILRICDAAGLARLTSRLRR